MIQTTATYEDLHALLTGDGSEDYNGVALQRIRDAAGAMCDKCGMLSPTWSHGWSSDWLTLASQARDHAKENWGHNVVVALSRMALYSMEAKDE